MPEDLQSILNDTSLFNKDSDITTKEILKRYGDRSSTPAHYPIITDTEKSSSNQQGSAPSSKVNGARLRPAAPFITHVEGSDPDHTHNWPKESSVRHVQAPGAAAPVYPSQSNNGGTTPLTDWEFVESQGPYTHQRADSGDSHSSQGAPTTTNRQSYRHSAWGNGGGPGGGGGKRNLQGQMGVTGVGS